jgi:flagellar biosynthesis/type III secretory pathway protein FliH
MSAEPFVFEPLETRGELIPAAASPADRASEIVAAARAQAAQIEADARAEGLRAGLAEGYAAAEEELAATRAALGGVLGALQESRGAYVAAAERDVVELAIAIAEKIVGAALAADPALVCSMVAGALRAVEGGDGVVLEVNPDDVELVQRWLDSTTIPLAAKLDLRAERRIGRGGCVVRTADGEIDARVREQLDRAEEVLRETLAAGA